MVYRKSKRLQVPFASKLVLNQWLLSLFKVSHFEELAKHLRNDDLEGLDESNIHHFHHVIAAQFIKLPQLSTDLLLEYDHNIVMHTRRLNERRITRGEEQIVWKHFQYLALLFTEIYLDRYFSDPQRLLEELNEWVATYNADKPKVDQVANFAANGEAWSALNKLAFWIATGSGKTLLMHVNILQYRHFLRRNKRQHELNRILLLTPNEGLSQQHLREFEVAGIEAELFNKDSSGLSRGQMVEILEVTRLRDEMGDKTVAIDAFEGNNLVLVDEGHRGASAGKEGVWMSHRNALCERGFSFEYSATFGQAVKGSQKLTGLYARSTLCDYSYRYFYQDGFGKDYQILNLDQGTQQNHMELYLVACLLSFFQQQRLYGEHGKKFRPFNIENPLWVFVGGRVTKKLATKEASDIIEILLFLARYVSDRSGSIQRIEQVLTQGLINASGNDMLAGHFSYLNVCGLKPEQVFDETLATLFNATGGGQLYVENLKNAAGEIALRLGAENQAFGVINVGDDAKLVRLCEEKGLATGQREFSGSLFHEIDRPRSSIHLLIGSKKFTEGWNSWRVSTMGLMNVGKGEGAQIIQLFGRGVRLKGYGLSLKRSGQMRFPEDVARPQHIRVLETLGIFGIQADYMEQFRNFLNEESLPADKDCVEFRLPVIKDLGTRTLKMIRLKKTLNGDSPEFSEGFRRHGPIPTIAPPSATGEKGTIDVHKKKVLLNWYPKIRAIKSGDAAGNTVDTVLNEAYLTDRHLAFMDFNRIYFELERFKSERRWHNLNIPRQEIEGLLSDSSWYCLQVPEEELIGDSYDKVHLWEEIATALLKKYIERYYIFRKCEWELTRLEYRDLESDDPNFLCAKEPPGEGYHRILLDKSQEELVTKLGELKAAIQRGELRDWEFQGIHAVFFPKHLYLPLLCLDRDVVQISPIPLNKGERQFVKDLKEYFDQNPDFFETRKLYLLRNQSKGRGIGFFEAGNFYPDFILWLLVDGQQHIIFVDPKGLQYLGSDDPKIQFYKTIKEIEQRLNDPTVHLHSFIISNTSFAKVAKSWQMEKSKMQRLHILFQKEDKESYIRTMLEVSQQESL